MKPLAALACALCLVPSLPAVIATGLSSFEGMEQPLERYFPARKAVEPERFNAITDEGGGTFRMSLRYGPDWWDGDRDTHNRDRQRAEVKGLGPHQKLGETFEYGTTWRIDPAFHGTTRFFHVFQVKATEGDDGAPLITLSLDRDPHHVTVRYWPGKDRDSHIAREFRCEPGAWESVRIRVRTSMDADGEVLVSVNGDAFAGVKDLPIYRPDAKDYRPKWGLYRGLTAGMNLSDDFVEHRAVYAQNLASPPIDNAALEQEARIRAQKSPTEALSWLEAQPPSPGRSEAIGAIGSLWAESNPSAAMDWALRLSDSTARSQTLLRVFDRWHSHDSEAAASWLLGHAPDPGLDAILWYESTDASFRHALPEATLVRCAALITDPERRLRAYEVALPIWAHKPGGQAEAVRYAREEANLPAAQRETLARNIEGLSPVRAADPHD